jgi:hypothetical protein
MTGTGSDERCVLMIQSTGKSAGTSILKNYITTDQIAPLTGDRP